MTTISTHRETFRDSCDGISVLINVSNAALFGQPSKVGVATSTDEDEPRSKVLPCNPAEVGVACLTAPPTVEQCSVLCETLKILFNQTLHWKEQYDKVCEGV